MNARNKIHFAILLFVCYFIQVASVKEVGVFGFLPIQCEFLVVIIIADLALSFVNSMLVRRFNDHVSILFSFPSRFQDCTDLARDDETLLVFSTLGGGLTAVDPTTSEIRWSIEDGKLKDISKVIMTRS